MAEAIELKIYNQEDRLTVTQILVKNGYTVGQARRQKTPTGKTVDYVLKVTEDPDNVSTTK